MNIYLSPQIQIIHGIQNKSKCSVQLPILLASPEVDSIQFSSVQSLSHVRLFATPWIAACQASLSITNSQSSLRLRQVLSEKPMSGLNPLSMGMDNKDLEKVCTLITWEPLPSQTIPLVLLLTLGVSAWLSLISQAPSVFSYYIPVLLFPVITYLVE